MKIGVLDIQGSVKEHFEALEKLEGIEPIRVKKVADLNELKGLIIPGGESTTIEKLLKRFCLWEEIVERTKNESLGIWGTCAGAILLSKMGLMKIEVERNAYGGQLDSFEEEIDFDGSLIPAVFIRAPKIKSVGKGVEVIANYRDDIVAARSEKILATTFHPELTEETIVLNTWIKGL